jgi:opacity protein-like surface antigen
MKTICSLVAIAPRSLSVCFMLLLIGSATVIHAQAQRQEQDRQAGVYFLTVAPRGEFSENLPNNGYGIGAQALFPIGSSPFKVGGDLGFVIYGSESRTEPISPTIPDVQVRVNTSNFILLPHFMLRAQPRSGLIRPYVDGLIGLKYLWTETSISDRFGDEDVVSDINLSDTSFSYGVGGGLQVPLMGGRESRLLLDMGVRYLRGGRAEYLREGSIREVDGSVVYDVLSSRTDVLTVQVGVMFRF